MRPSYDRAAWARRKAAGVRRQLDALAAERIPSSDWRDVRRKAQAMARLRAEAAKFDSIAGAAHDDGALPF